MFKLYARQYSCIVVKTNPLLVFSIILSRNYSHKRLYDLTNVYIAYYFINKENALSNGGEASQVLNITNTYTIYSGKMT